MKKAILFLSSICFLFLFLSISRVSWAQTSDIQRVDPDFYIPRVNEVGSGPATIFGEDHSYTVTFRGNGEAVVNMRVVFTNFEESTISAVALKVPKVNLENISVYQVIKEPSCIQYEPQKYDDKIGNYLPKMPKCLQYQEPDYHSYYSQGQTTYSRGSIEMLGDVLNIYLPHEIGPQSSGSYILYYRSSGYTKKDMYGAYMYSFETLQSDNVIANLTIGVTTDSDLKLKGAKTNVNYDIAGASMPMMAEKTRASLTGYQFDDYYRRIGWGTVVKTATDLQPNDSFTVDGTYAKSWMSLYGKQIWIGILIAIGIVALLVGLTHRLLKHLPQSKASEERRANSPHHSNVIRTLLVIGASFFSSICAAGFTVLIYILFMFLESAYYTEFNLFIVLLLILIAFVVYPFLIFGAPLFIGIRKGVWWGVGTFVLTIVWLCIYLFMFFMYLFFVRSSRDQPVPVYMKGVAPAGQTESEPGIRTSPDTTPTTIGL